MQATHTNRKLRLADEKYESQEGAYLGPSYCAFSYVLLKPGLFFIFCRVPGLDSGTLDY